MIFIETFTAVFIAQICVWIIERYIKKRMDATADKIEHLVRRAVKGGKMTKLMIDIEKSTNGSYIMTHYKKTVSGIDKVLGVKEEKEVLVFNNSREIGEWIDKNG